MDVMIFWERLRILLTQEESSLHGVKDWIQILHTEVQSMCEFLRNVEGSIGREHKFVGDTVLKIIDVAHEAEDAIDTFIINGMEQRSGEDLQEHQKQLYDAISSVKSDVDEIRTKIHEIYGNQAAFGIRQSIHRHSHGMDYSSSSKSTVGRGRGPILKEPHMVGREDDMEILLDSLIEGESQLTVVSIVGMGGIGKTTLAAEAYNSIYVKSHFDCRAWVCASSEYEQEELLGAVLKGVIPLSVSNQGMSAHEMEKTLRGYLSNKKYIIVLDDVWSSDLWKHLSSVLPDDKNGSRVLLTTRILKVAHFGGQHEVRPLKLRFLTTYESWKLLYNRVFGDGICAPELKVVGTSTADKFNGLPLAIMLLAGSLSKKEKNYHVWKKVDSDLFAGVNDRKWTNFGKILFYFYLDLPNYLKPCFLYFGVFPHDFEISAQHLFRLWIAEGFIPESSEEIAEEYLEELIDRGFIRPVKRRSDGKIKKCRIHDLSLHLSVFAADNLKLFHVAREQNRDDTTLINSRRLAVHISIPKFISSNFYAPHMRSFLCITSRTSCLASDENYSCRSFKLLRVLDVGAVVFEHLPKAIENLFHLKYLRLDAPFLKSLPSSLCNLRNLCTLDMFSSRINHVPHEIWKMQSLRHLHFSYILLPGVPNPETNCNSLRDLNFISTLCPSSCTQDVLGRLPNLRTLRVCGDLSSHHEALSNNLSKLHCLESLKLVGNVNMSPIELRLLRFPPSLTHLILWNTGLGDDPMPTLEKLPNLRVLKLKQNSYWGRKLACSSGGFPSLQVLHLKSMQWLDEWSMGAGAMPQLVCLVINPCAYLRRLPEELWRVESFRKLELWWPRPELKPRLREIEDMDHYDVQIYPSGL